MSWYAEQRAVLSRAARAHGHTLRRAAGIAAALSPLIRWESCLSGTLLLLENPNATRGIAGIRSNVAKARKIAKGSRPLSVLSGPKVRSFYRCLLGDPNAVCVDSHVFNHYLGLNRLASKTPSISPARYELVSQAIRKEARELGITPARHQSDIWLRQRESSRTIKE